MKPFLLALLFIFLSANPVFARSEWDINNFHSDIVLQDTGVVLIQEKIDVDFNDLEKHGIYRDIPITYQNKTGQKTYSKIDVISVMQDKKNAVYDTSDNESNLRIKIGDANKKISGEHSYIIIYTATGVLRSFTNYDEFYWNVTGDEWEADIINATATVKLPKEKIENVSCFEGYTGSTASCSVTAQTPTTVSFATTQFLSAYEGMTVAVAYTRGMVPLLTVSAPKKISDEIFTTQSLVSFFFALIGGIILIIYLWMKNGRDFWFHTRRQFDPKAKEERKPLGAHEPVIVEFTPPEKLRPAELGVLMDERADTLDVTATIVDLANRGFLKISEIEKKWLFGSKDYELERTKLADDKLLSYEKLLLDRLFATGSTVKISSLKTKFYDDLADVKKKLYEDVMRKKLFVENPESKRNIYLGIGFGIMFLGAICIFLGFKVINGPLVMFGIGTMINSVIFIFASQSMPRRSAYGRELYQRVKGYRLFISSAEKYRQQFFENKNMFNDVLSYAIVFGLTGKFAQAMKEMGVTPSNPTWYSGSHAFTPAVFASDVNSFSKSLSTAIASTPSSSGTSGGSSGGGFGGGGGGSW